MTLEKLGNDCPLYLYIEDYMSTKKPNDLNDDFIKMHVVW